MQQPHDARKLRERDHYLKQAGRQIRPPAPVTRLRKTIRVAIWCPLRKQG